MTEKEVGEVIFKKEESGGKAIVIHLGSLDKIDDPGIAESITVGKIDAQELGKLLALDTDKDSPGAYRVELRNDDGNVYEEGWARRVDSSVGQVEIGRFTIHDEFEPRDGTSLHLKSDGGFEAIYVSSGRATIAFPKETSPIALGVYGATAERNSIEVAAGDLLLIGDPVTNGWVKVDGKCDFYYVTLPVYGSTNVKGALDVDADKPENSGLQPRPIDEAFKRFTVDIETLWNTEVRGVVQSITIESRRFLQPLREKGLLDEAKETEIVRIWGNCIVLGSEQATAFGDFKAAPLVQAAKELRAVDREGENTEVQELAKKADRLAEDTARITRDALAYVCRANLAQMELAKVAGMPDVTVVINWGNKDEFIGRPERIRAIAFEETPHLISEFEKYGIQSKWLEEMMGRVVGFWGGTGHKRTDPEFKALKKDMRADAYLALFNLMNRLVGNEYILLSMFFGKEPSDSVGVAKVKKAVEEADLIGHLIDAGATMDTLVELYQRNQNKKS